MINLIVNRPGRDGYAVRNKDGPRPEGRLDVNKPGTIGKARHSGNPACGCRGLSAYAVNAPRWESLAPRLMQWASRVRTHNVEVEWFSTAQVRAEEVAGTRGSRAGEVNVPHRVAYSVP